VVERLLIAVLIAAAYWSQEKTVPIRRPPRPIKIPDDAKEIRPGLWKAVDKSGQVWVYWNSPFGVVRAPEKPGDEIKPDMPKSTAAVSTDERKLNGPVTVDNITVEEDGETIRFERRLPFGPQRWSRKKTELNEEERRIWKQAQAASVPPSKDTPPSKPTP